MGTRLFGVFNAFLLSLVFSTNAYASLATADVFYDWTTFSTITTGNLAVAMVGPMGDSGNAATQGGPFVTDETDTFGGLDLVSADPSSSASLITTAESIDASANTTLGFGFATFERAFSYEALSGSGILTVSVDVVLQAAVEGAGSAADAAADFGYHIGESGTLSSVADLEMYGDSGDKSQTLPITLSFSVFMQQGDIIDMEAEGEAYASVSAIPIPSAVWLFGSGLLGIIGVSRRKEAA